MVNAGTLLVNTPGPDSGTGVGDVLVNGGTLGGNATWWLGSMTSGKICGTMHRYAQYRGSLALTSGTFDWNSLRHVTPSRPWLALDQCSALKIASATILAVRNLAPIVWRH